MPRQPQTSCYRIRRGLVPGANGARLAGAVFAPFWWWNGVPGAYVTPPGVGPTVAGVRAQMALLYPDAEYLGGFDEVDGREWE